MNQYYMYQSFLAIVIEWRQYCPNPETFIDKVTEKEYTVVLLIYYRIRAEKYMLENVVGASNIKYRFIRLSLQRRGRHLLEHVYA